MEGELVYVDIEERPATWARDAADTSSPLGQLYAKWNANQRRTIDEYDRRRRAIENHTPIEERIWTSSSGDDPEARTSRPAFSTASITIETVSIVSGVEVLTATASPA